MAKQPWHMAKPDLFEEVKAEITEAYPALEFSIKDGKVFIEGAFPLIDKGRIVDEYEIEIALPHNFPKGTPIVWETRGRIPRTAADHMYTDGKTCLFVPGERWRYWPEGSSLLEFLDNPVKSFFVGNSLAELGEKRPWGERSHGAEGIFEAYSEMVQSDDPQTIYRYIQSLARPRLRAHRPCPCGSGKALKKCHLAKVKRLRSRIRYWEARRALEIVQRELTVRWAAREAALRRKVF